jgi:protein-disulfide isomerase
MAASRFGLHEKQGSRYALLWITGSAAARLSAMTASVLFCATMTYGQPMNCAALDAAAKSRVLQVAARSMGTDPVQPVIDSEALLPGTCYWQFFVSLPNNRGHGVLYVSPDLHFVSPALWDMNVDYEKEDAKIAAQLQKEADADNPPVRGPKSARATVVVFLDFQCPFCAGFAHFVAEYQKQNPGKTRLIVRNNPLPMHKWAGAAARAGICVAQQSPGLFWQFEDFLFAKQKEIASDNLGEHVQGFLHGVPEARIDSYLECMATPYPEDRLEKDMQEARIYQVHSTPTVFINGRRYRGFANMGEFAAAVEANNHAEAAVQEKER